MSTMSTVAGQRPVARMATECVEWRSAGKENAFGLRSLPDCTCQSRARAQAAVFRIHERKGKSTSMKITSTKIASGAMATADSKTSRRTWNAGFSRQKASSTASAPMSPGHLRRLKSALPFLNSPWAMAALCLALVGTVRSADTPYGAKPGAEPESQPQTKSAEGSLARYNKATGIVGMDVRNHKDERLGEIKDVVFDLNSERVAYAVLATGGIPARQKY